MTRRFAILLDGGFVTKQLYRRLGARHATAEDVRDEVERIKDHDLLAGFDLLRVYFYDARPATGQLKRPVTGLTENLGRSEVHGRMSVLHDSLELSQDFALRMGSLNVRGWRLKSAALKDIAKTGRPLGADDVIPNIDQKGVDLRIGLDIARLALRQVVHVIVVVTGDADMVPAFKFARREGVRVYLDHLDGSVSRELKVHADAILA